MKYNIASPYIAGFGFDQKPFDSTKGYQKVQQLAYEFDTHTNNDLISGFMEIYLVSTILANSLLKTSLTGFKIDNVKIEYSLNYQHFHQDKQNLDYHWLKVCGIAGLDDFGLTEKYELVVSENALSFLRDFKILDADIMPFE